MRHQTEEQEQHILGHGVMEQLQLGSMELTFTKNLVFMKFV